MKILALNPYYTPHVGGLEKYSDELLTNLEKSGNSIIIFTSAIPSAEHAIERHGNITIYRFPAWEIVYNYPLPNIFTAAFWKLLRKAQKEQYDAVMSVTRFFITTPLAYLISRIRGIPWLHIEHGSGFVISSSPLIRLTAYLYDTICSPYLFQRTSLTVAPSLSAQKFVGL